MFLVCDGSGGVLASWCCNVEYIDVVMFAICIYQVGVLNILYYDDSIHLLLDD